MRLTSFEWAHKTLHRYPSSWILYRNVLLPTMATTSIWQLISVIKFTLVEEYGFYRPRTKYGLLSRLPILFKNLSFGWFIPLTETLELRTWQPKRLYLAGVSACGGSLVHVMACFRSALNHYASWLVVNWIHMNTLRSDNWIKTHIAVRS